MSWGSHPGRRNSSAMRMSGFVLHPSLCNDSRHSCSHQPTAQKSSQEAGCMLNGLSQRRGKREPVTARVPEPQHPGLAEGP